MSIQEFVITIPVWVDSKDADSSLAARQHLRSYYSAIQTGANAAKIGWSLRVGAAKLTKIQIKE